MALVAIVLLSSLPATPGGVAPGQSRGSAPGPVGADLGPSASHTAAGRSGAISPTYFQSQTIPLPSNSSCTSVGFGGGCFNATVEPSINYTSTGLVAMAYTALANATPCPNSSGGAQSVVGFTTAAAPGHAWSSPAYLADPVCSTARQYSSAWQPTLTSLANGTLVLAYIQYNMTSASIPTLDCSSVPYDRLVVTRSFNNGTTWTTPLVLNNTPNTSLGCPVGLANRPWITAFGNT
ncbi:MAG: hypothetical protein L3K17_07640, partial [Thermoplasmata archaeon]|nr:hypothetical protein [Thermoplasmata archaeon]